MRFAKAAIVVAALATAAAPGIANARGGWGFGWGLGLGVALSAPLIASAYYAPRYPRYDRGYSEPYGYAPAPVVRTYVYSEPHYGYGYEGGYRHWDHDEGRHRGWGEHRRGHHDRDDDDD